MKQYGKYYFGAIALFIIVANAGAGTAFAAGAKGVADVTKSLQGRS